MSEGKTVSGETELIVEVVDFSVTSGLLVSAGRGDWAERRLLDDNVDTSVRVDMCETSEGTTLSGETWVVSEDIDP